MLKVLHVPYTFYPDPCGGTEVYVEALARSLIAIGVESVIAAPGSSNATYKHIDLDVFRFAIQDVLALKDLYGEGDEIAEKNFCNILDRVKPDLVHFHAISPAISLRLVKKVKNRQIPIILTYHTPTASCLRGTLLKWGVEVCDGIMGPAQCVPCLLHGLGMPKFLAIGLNKLPSRIGQIVELSGKSKGILTALQIPWLVPSKLKIIRSFFDEVDHIVAVCNWVKMLLYNNGVDPNKITLSRQGLCHHSNEIKSNISKKGISFPNAIISSPSVEPVLRIAFLGRLDPTKGPEILIRAMEKISGVQVNLDLIGIAQGVEGEKYLQFLKVSTQNDIRIRFLQPVPVVEVVTFLSNYDLLAVPSQLLETGPMVVLEAFAAGIPVIGSKLGGISELIDDGVNGYLISASDVSEWAKVISRLANDPQELVRLKHGIRQPKTISSVANEMSEVYQLAVRRKLH